MHPPSDAPTSFVVVNLGAIARNVRALKAHVGPAVQLMAVVKANAYGHGMVEVARTVLANGADRLAVARAAEGAALRQAGVAAPVLVMGYTAPADIPPAIAHDLTLTVTEPETVQVAAQQAAVLDRRATVHVKVDTGMGRFGLLPDEVVPFLNHLATYPELRLEGLFTHFAVADLADKSYTRWQFERFQRVLAEADAAGHHVALRHCANSAATLDLPETHLDAVRVGIALYGLRPSNEIEPAVSLEAALSVRSHVGRVRTLPKGASISYGRTFITPRAMPVALVPLGYGDGVHRLLSNRGAVLINGRRAPIVGRVCMDQFVVDVSEVGPVQLNDEVVLLGRQGDARITAEEIAGWAETINYEVTTSLLPRLPRRYES